MKKFRLSTIAIALGLAGSAFVPAAINAQQDVPKMHADQKLGYAAKIVERYYVDDSVNTDHAAEQAIIAMLKTLDPHSQYSNVEETRQLNEPLQGNFSGVGIQFALNNDTLMVVQTIAGGPSERVGIVAGDRILAAGDSILSGAKRKNADIQRLLRGPKGSRVVLKVERRGEPAPRTFNVTRDDIPINSVDASYMAAPGVGYIKLSRFAESSAKEIEKAAKELKKQGMKDLILDLSYNGGGYLSAAADIAEMFLNRGDVIVSTKGDKVANQELRATKKNQLIDGRLVVIVNQYSASASEILSGAIQDHDRGLVVGRRTFGKGLVQRPFPFPDGSMIRLTVARYYTPSGRCIQKPYSTDDDSDSYERDILHRYESGELSNADSVHVNKAEAYRTLRNGRTVYGGGGVMPDLFVAIDTTQNNAYARDLLGKGVYSSFSIKYIDTHRKQLSKTYRSEDSFISDFQVGEPLLKEFTDYAAKEGVAFNEEQYNEALPTIKAIIKGMIGRDLFSQSTYFRVINELGNEYREALQLIQDTNRYNSLLLAQ
ncbi:MAG: S41 family peptidase [Bacteroides sp.]|nr:S41 family peptidase [Bacteroides sp.]